MDILTKYIDCVIPVTSCNFNCSYCYITQNDRWSNKPPQFNYSAVDIRKALSKERLGGPCLVNLCGAGETLIPHETLEIMKELLEEGHYVMVVTNGTLTNRIDEIVSWDKSLLEKLLFKFSFHYMELLKNEKMDTYFSNINKSRKAGASITLEMVPDDSLIEKIDEIKDICMKNIGALCHLTVGREDSKPLKPLLSKYTPEEYYNIWKSFDSELFEFKMKTFSVKRTEFCNAGKLSYALNLGTGILKQCYAGNVIQNVFEDIDKPLKIDVVENNCRDPHCCNSHAFIAMGIIPEILAPNYAELRNRKCSDGTEWLAPKMKEFLNTKVTTE